MPPVMETIEVEQGTWNQGVIYYRRNYLNIRFHAQGMDDADFNGMLDTVFTGLVSDYQLKGRVGSWGYVKLLDGSSPIAVAEAVSPKRPVVYAEPDMVMEECAEPDDPLIYQDSAGSKWQWAIETLDFLAAWDIEQGRENVVIGLLDSGLPLDEATMGGLAKEDRLAGYLTHADFDGNRFLAGTNYALDPYAPIPHDNDRGHGVRMAGIIAAEEDNGEGIAGINWNSDVYVCRVSDQYGKTTGGLVYMAIAEVVDYAERFATPKHVVINMSFTFLKWSKEDEDVDYLEELTWGTFKDFSDKVAEAGGVLVCAAGNSDDPVGFPAAGAYVYPDTIVAVGASAVDGAIYGLSNHGDTVETADGVQVELELSVVAPGENVCSTELDGGHDVGGGTSEAAAHVTGLVSLMWSHNDDMTAAQIIQCLQNTSAIPEEILDGWSDPAGLYPEHRYGHGIINPEKALSAVEWLVELDTPAIEFDGVPAGEEPSALIELTVTSCASITFTVEKSGDDFGVAEVEYTYDPVTDTVSPRMAATYFATLPEEARGNVLIHWAGAESPLSVDITARRIAAQNALIMLTLDKSGSMREDSGIGKDSRLDVLKDSSGIMVDNTDPGSAVGVVSFDATSHLVTEATVIKSDDPESYRERLKTNIGDLYGNGETSIGAGVQRAIDELDAVADDLVDGDEAKAIVVVTDGMENTEPWLADVLAGGVPYPVYAIGMGTAETLEPEGLITLSMASGGYAVLTGASGDEDEFLVAKFYDQILAEITGDSPVVEPSHRLLPGSTHEYRVKVCRADKRLDVILMRPQEAPISVQLATPDGHTVPEDFDGLKVTNGTRVTRLQLSLPANVTGDGQSHRGSWRVRLSADLDQVDDYLGVLAGRDIDVTSARVHGVRYLFGARVRSNLRMRARVYQQGFTPGSNFLLRAVMTQNDLALIDPLTRIVVTVTYPDGVQEDLLLARRGPGTYQANFTAAVPGVYDFHFLAKGQTRQHDEYRRECLLTGAVWNPPPPGQTYVPPLIP